MPFLINIERTAGDRYSIEFQIGGFDSISGLVSQFRIEDSAGDLVGVLDGSVSDSATGMIEFDPDDVEVIRDLEAGSYAYSLILDPDGDQRRTFAAGAYTLLEQPVPTEDDEIPAGGFSGYGYAGYVFATPQLPSEAQIDLYVSSADGDDTDDASEASPVATIQQALRRIPALMWGQRLVVHLAAGHTETLVRQVILPPILGAGLADDVVLTGDEPAWDYLRQQIMIQCAPTTVETVTGALTTVATCGLTIVTDATKNWTPGEHAGRSLINPGQIAEVAVIYDNTATELLTSSVGFSDGTLSIVERAATLTMGDGAAFVTSGLTISATLASVGLVGLNLLTPGAGPAVDLSSGGRMSLLMCEVSGGFQVDGSAGKVALDACYVHGGSWAPNAGSIAVRQSFLSGLTASFHAVNGQYDLYGSRVIGCGSMGHGGTTTPHGGFRIDNCWISGSTSHGVLNLGGMRSRITNTRIDSSTGDAIRFEGTGTMLVDTVVGTGSSAYGATVDNGAIVVPAGTITVAGTSGQVRLGGSGGATFDWSQAPQSNTSRFCRFGT